MCSPSVSIRDWLRQIEEYKSAEVLPPAKGFSPRAIIEEVNRRGDADTVVATDVGQHQMWTCSSINLKSPRGF